MSIPRQAQIRLAVGQPIEVPIVHDPSDDLINTLRNVYFTELLALCEKYKFKCDAPNTVVVAEPALPHVSRQDWSAMLVKLKSNTTKDVVTFEGTSFDFCFQYNLPIEYAGALYCEINLFLSSFSFYF